MAVKATGVVVTVEVKDLVIVVEVVELLVTQAVLKLVLVDLSASYESVRQCLKKTFKYSHVIVTVAISLPSVKVIVSVLVVLTVVV